MTKKQKYLVVIGVIAAIIAIFLYNFSLTVYVWNSDTLPAQESIHIYLTQNVTPFTDPCNFEGSVIQRWYYHGCGNYYFQAPTEVPTSYVRNGFLASNETFVGFYISDWTIDGYATNFVLLLLTFIIAAIILIVYFAVNQFANVIRKKKT
jgi:hypothetical protein